MVFHLVVRPICFQKKLKLLSSNNPEQTKIITRHPEHHLKFELEDVSVEEDFEGKTIEDLQNYVLY